MRIGVVTNHLSQRGGGIAAAIRALYAAIGQLPGADVTLFGGDGPTTDTGDPPTSSVGDKAAYQEVHYPVLGSPTLAFSPRLPRLLRESGFDIVHTHGLWSFPSIAAVRWHRKTGRPYVVSPHGMLDPWAVRHSGWKKMLAGPVERTHLGHAACVHALNQAEADAVRAFCHDSPVRIIANGVDLPDDGGTPADRPEWAEAIAEKSRILLFLGRLHPKKGLMELLRSFAAAVAANPTAEPWVLVIAGWDQDGHEATLKKLVQGLGIDGRVIFAGPQFGKAKIASYCFADAFILPSHSEGLPMTVLEAWSHGLPVLMTGACNLPEGFAQDAAIEIDHQGGQMAAGLCRFFELNEPARRAIGDNGLALVRRQFTWERAAREMYDLYGTLLAEPGNVRISRP